MIVISSGKIHMTLIWKVLEKKTSHVRVHCKVTVTKTLGLCMRSLSKTEGSLLIILVTT